MPRLVLRKKKTLPKRKVKVRIRRKALRKPRVVPPAGPVGGDLYNGGYDDGYNKGFNKGHEEGYQQGKYDGEGRNEWRDGVDGLIDTFLPEYEILPDFTAEQILAAGVESLRPQWRHLLNPDEIAGRILHALDTRTPFSLVRVGDGEVLALAQGTVLSVEQVREQGSFLGYAGIDVPDYEARDQLKEAIRQASVVGIPKLRVRNFQPLALSSFKANGIDHGSLTLTDSLINYYLYQTGYMSRILRGRRVLIAGKLGEPLADYMRTNGINVTAVVSPVEGVKDVPRVMEEIAARDFDIALVAAGIAAVLISQRIATQLGKVAIDFGHLANAMINGEAPFK
ncbi:GT-D fold domain-containing glycosyltransferase [Paenibacillus hodogayensis]|uniref:GT-D fold domain-containing glycosyltransferase n=1 Tax=Paenibacillus hodogayensis TaxID=279208 RepID=A0ABV5VTS7_9BACL